MCIALVHQGAIQIKNGSTTQLCIHVACVSVHYHNTRLFFWKPATAFIWKQWSFCRNTMLSILAPVGGSRGQCGVWFSISHSPHFSPHWTLFKVYKSTHHSCHCIAVWCNALLYSDMQSCMECCVDLSCVSVWIFCVFSQWCAFYDAVKCLSLHAVWFSFIYLELANLMLPTDWRSLVLTHGGVVASTQKARNLLLQIAGRKMAYLLKFCTPFVLVYLVDLKW